MGGGKRTRLDLKGGEVYRRENGASTYDENERCIKCVFHGGGTEGEGKRKLYAAFPNGGLESGRDGRWYKVERRS